MADMTREALLERAVELQRKIEGIFDDVAHWNRAHPDDDQIDPDPGGTLKTLYDGLGDMIRKELRISVSGGEETQGVE